MPSFTVGRALSKFYCMGKKDKIKFYCMGRAKFYCMGRAKFYCMRRSKIKIYCMDSSKVNYNKDKKKKRRWKRSRI